MHKSFHNKRGETETIYQRTMLRRDGALSLETLMRFSNLISDRLIITEKDGLVN